MTAALQTVQDTTLHYQLRKSMIKRNRNIVDPERSRDDFKLDVERDVLLGAISERRSYGQVILQSLWAMKKWEMYAERSYQERFGVNSLSELVDQHLGGDDYAKRMANAVDNGLVHIHRAELDGTPYLDREGNPVSADAIANNPGKVRAIKEAAVHIGRLVESGEQERAEKLISTVASGTTDEVRDTIRTLKNPDVKLRARKEYVRNEDTGEVMVIPRFEPMSEAAYLILKSRLGAYFEEI